MLYFKREFTINITSLLLDTNEKYLFICLEGSQLRIVGL